MFATRWALGAILAATAISASTDELQFFARLLKRQDPGSPSYNCHDNCGEAIIQGRSSADACHDNIFLTDYKCCLQCAGPDNQDIWQYYGSTLTKDATPCGLSTTPLSGKQPDVGPALPASSGSSSKSSSASEETSSASETKPEASPTEASPTESATSTETPGATESQSEGSSVASTTAEVTPSATGETPTPSATESHTGHGSATVTESASVTSAWNTVSTHAPQGTGSGSSGIATATTSSGYVVVTNAANAVSGSPVGFYGALALGAMYAAAQ